MQIGFDVGATKIESVVLEETGQENFRERTDCPKDYHSVINNINVYNDTIFISIHCFDFCFAIRISAAEQSNIARGNDKCQIR